MTIKITYNNGDSYITTIPNESYADNIACILDSIHTNCKREVQDVQSNN